MKLFKPQIVCFPSLTMSYYTVLETLLMSLPQTVLNNFLTRFKYADFLLINSTVNNL